MKFSLIVCTYSRANSLKRLLDSVVEQRLYPNEILIVDGSEHIETESMLSENSYNKLSYYKVNTQDRGLTKQRNIGILKSNADSEILCFLDDDIVLKPDYFEKLLVTFHKYPNAIAVGGAIINEDVWKQNFTENENNFGSYYYKGWERNLGARNVLRKKLGLLSDRLPGIMPNYSNGFSIGYYPPNGDIHKVEYFMGGVSAYRKELFRVIKFSEYYIGYGLYEDMDFCLRASKLGELYLNTGAQVYHLHEESGRPNSYKYGKMVVENGWVVWKLKNPKPQLIDMLKWNIIVLLLITIRLKNAFLDNEKGAFKDALGRIAALIKLGIKKPQYF